MKISTLGVICLQRATGLSVRYVKRPGLRPGSVLNILFCFVSFWPVGTQANFGHGDRRAHLQSTELTESCYSHKEAVRTRPCLGEEVSSKSLFLFCFFLLSRRDWQDYANGERREGRAGGKRGGDGT